MNLDAIDIGILGPALVAGLLVLATHVPLGREVLARGIIFIDLAIAQVAGLGVIAAHFFGEEPGAVTIQIAALTAALAAAALLNFTQKRWPDIQEALIGTLFILAASAGILLLAGNPHAGESLKELLVGQILWVNYAQLIPVALLSAVILMLWFGARAKLGRIGFYAMFAVAVTASVQLVGVYLVFASLIVPALASRFHPPRRQLVVGYSVGVLGYALGLVASAVFDLPSGAVIVWALAVCGIGAAWLASLPAEKL